MSGELSERLGAYVSEAYLLRDAVSVGSGIEGPVELHALLLRTRSSVDRLERLVADLVRVRGRASQATADRKADLEDAWRESATSSRTSVGLDYASARERDAVHGVRTVAQQVALRRAERELRDVETALEVCRLLHRGADAVRADLNAAIRALTFETRLER